MESEHAKPLAHSIGRVIHLAESEDFEAAQAVLHECLRKSNRINHTAKLAAMQVLQRVTRKYGLSLAPGIAGDDIVGKSIEDVGGANLPGISLVTCSMNRTDNLVKALQSWQRIDRISEIVIVDWSSDTPVAPELQRRGIADPRIRVIRVEGQRRWILSYAFNVGFWAANFDKIVKADADIVIEGDFFERHALGSNDFFAGNWRLADEGQEHINGFFYVNRDALTRINGFNEYITTYGWDDDDLFERLAWLGLERKDVDPARVYHLPHDDDERFEVPDASKQESALGVLKANVHYKGRRNRFIANVMPLWKKGRPHNQYRIVSLGDGFISCEMDGAPARQVPTHVEEDASYYAALQVLSWRFGPNVYECDPEELWELLSRKSLDAIAASDFVTSKRPADSGSVAPTPLVRRPKMYIDAQHGLGNRLRAIGSAAAIAEATDRDLVIVWQPDDHCDCRFSDLFVYDGAVIEESFIADAKTCNVYNYMSVEAGIKDAPIQSDDRHDIYARSAFVLRSPHSTWERENRFLQSLRPVEAVYSLVNSVRHPNDVSVHVRMEGGRKDEHLAYESTTNWTENDHDLIGHWRSKSHFSRFGNRIDALIAKDAVERIFVAADKPETYEEFGRRYGDRVAWLERSVYDRSAEQLRYALADAILLGRAPVLLGSTWSSFSELAQRLSSCGMAVEMSGRDF